MTDTKPTIEVVNVHKDTIVKTGERFLNVQAVIKDGDLEMTRNFGFELGTAQEAIEADLGKALQLYVDEKATAEANADANQAEEEANQTIEALQGATITN